MSSYKTFEEMFHQKDALDKSYHSIVNQADALRAFVKEYDPGEIVFSACGSSYWVSLSASLTMQRELGLRCSALKSGDVVMDGPSYAKAYKKPLLICPTRSGMTAETVISAKSFKEWYGAKMLVLTEREGSTLDEMGDFVIRQPWAHEKAQMQTQSFCSLYLSCITLAAVLAQNDALLASIRWYIDNYDRLSADAAARTKAIVDSEFAGYDYLVSMGTGSQYGLAVEAGYIQLEIARFRASYFATLEYRHGPYLTNTQTTLFSLFSTGAQDNRERKVLSELKRDGGRVLAISADTHFEEADWNFTLGQKTGPEMAGLYGVMVMYGIAYHRALRDGVNPDKPGQGDATREGDGKGYIGEV